MCWRIVLWRQLAMLCLLGPILAACTAGGSALDKAPPTASPGVTAAVAHPTLPPTRGSAISPTSTSRPTTVTTRAAATAAPAPTANPGSPTPSVSDLPLAVSPPATTLPDPHTRFAIIAAFGDPASGHYPIPAGML